MNNIDNIQVLKDIIDGSKYLVFFGGAGVSTASNIPDFRSSNGIFNEKYGNIPIERIISHSFFVKEPKIFYEVYKDKLVYKDAKPNYCHLVLKKLEDINILKTIITQNIDSLHQQAGSKNVIELHGSVYRNYCIKCNKFYSVDELLNKGNPPLCDCGSIIKPDVVLYEEALDNNSIINAIRNIEKADTLIIGGTSLSVYPAASFIEYFNGKNLIIINKNETNKDISADLIIREDISLVFKRLGELYGFKF